MTPFMFYDRSSSTSAQLRFSKLRKLQIPAHIFLFQAIAVFITSAFRFLFFSIVFCFSLVKFIQANFDCSRFNLSSFLGRITPSVYAAIAGALLFAAIAFQNQPVHAQLFNQAEQQTTSIFGQYLGNNIIPFMFGLLRVVVWVSAVGFILFAVYQAQRGEQWQPLMQNAFIVIAAVVIVEGLSSLFFGGGTGTTPTASPTPR